mmetsp:Transcript_19567/g.53579  ORF Transcript_19567/g.53579 Transcript_19567/m.53579 type:complete len:290 (-) Transcript_19567:156-1025(-)
MAVAPKFYEDSASQEHFNEPEETIIFFDWDDTLCPSGWIEESIADGLCWDKPPEAERFVQPLRKLDWVAHRLLAAARRLGTVVIVTAAEAPWVEMSCKNFLPSLGPLLRKIDVVYARSVYEELSAASAQTSARSSAHGNCAPGMYPAGMGRVDTEDSALEAAEAGKDYTGIDLEIDPLSWKKVAFRQALTKFYGDGRSWKNVVSIGDAVYEREGLRCTISTRPSRSRKCRTKTVKLLQEPTIEDMTRQLKLLYDGIRYIVAYPGNVDIEVTEDDIDFDMAVIEQLRSES